MTRGYMKPSEVGMMIAEKDFRVLARSYKRGEDFNPRKVFRKWRKDWRKVMNLYRRKFICTPDQWAEINDEAIKEDIKTEFSIALESGWNTDDAKPIAENDILTREELEEKYRDLGGRVNPDWSDEKLVEMIEKKYNQER